MLSRWARIIKELSQFFPGSGQDEVVPFNGLQHGLLKQVPPFSRASWGVACGRRGFESCACPNTKRPQIGSGRWLGMKSPLEINLTVHQEHSRWQNLFTNGECSSWAVRADCVRRATRLRIEMRQPSPRSTHQFWTHWRISRRFQLPRGMARHDDAFVASIVPASSAAV